MQRVIDLGVDGIITDDPDLLVAVARRNGLTVEPAVMLAPAPPAPSR